MLFCSYERASHRLLVSSTINIHHRHHLLKLISALPVLSEARVPLKLLRLQEQTIHQWFLRTIDMYYHHGPLKLILSLPVSRKTGVVLKLFCLHEQTIHRSFIGTNVHYLISALPAPPERRIAPKWFRL